jgi:hypothetical protein
MTRSLPLLLSLLLLAVTPPQTAAAASPDYSSWQELLSKHYDPAKGMNYKALKAQDAGTLKRLREQMAAVDVKSLPKVDQLAYWINLYNISVVGTVVDSYPIESIKDLSTDPIIRLNIFKKPVVKTREGMLSLNDIENVKIREGFKDPRIHFAINCAAESCPTIRTEPYAGSKVGQQLDDQSSKFLNGPKGVRLEDDSGELTLHTSKVMDWFGEDFQKWGGGQLAFLRKHLSADKVKKIDAAKGKVDIEYDDYSWKLNDASK